MDLTDRGQQAMTRAREEAARLGSLSVETEHLLLGLLLEEGGAVAKVLDALGIDGAAIRKAVEESVPPREATPTGAEAPPLSPRAGRAVHAAGGEALKLGRKAIGTEHLLLALLQESGGAAARTFDRLGQPAETVRKTILAVLELDEPEPPEGAPQRSDLVDQILGEIVKSHSEAIAAMIPSMSGVIAALPGGSLTGKLYRMLLEQIPAITFITSFTEGFQHVYVSPQIEKILGYTPDEWLRNPSLWLQSLHAEDSERWHNEFAANCGKGLAVRSAYRFLHKDGRVVWIQGDVRIERDKDDLPRFVQAVGFDVTEIKKREEELRERTLELEAANRERRKLEEQISRGQDREIVRLKSGKREGAPERLLLGGSERIQVVRTRIEKFAPSKAKVLITGETGTGKQLVAQAIHCNSPRAKGPFREVNCARLTGSLLEDELFGHEKDAYTDARRRRRGQFEQAHGGTLFLDEISKMPLNAQGQVLKVLDSGGFQRVGGEEDVHVDVRVICATNRDLKAAIKTGDFLEDLYYRIKEAEIEIAALRDRRDDIPLLARQFLGETDRAGLEFSPDALECLRIYSWPGNVRELRSAVVSSALECERGEILRRHLPKEVSGERPSGAVPLESGKLFEHCEPVERLLKAVFLGEDVGLDQARNEMARLVIGGAMKKHGGVRARAAKALAVSDRKLSDVMSRLGMLR